MFIFSSGSPQTLDSSAEEKSAGDFRAGFGLKIA